MSLVPMRRPCAKHDVTLTVACAGWIVKQLPVMPLIKIWYWSESAKNTVNGIWSMVPLLRMGVPLRLRSINWFCPWFCIVSCMFQSALIVPVVIGWELLCIILAG